MNYKEAREAVGLPTRQCPDCKVAGYTKATLGVTSAKMLRILARELPNERPFLVKQECSKCQGEGWIAA